MARRKAKSTKKGKKTNGKKSPVAATAPGFTTKTSGPHY
jgi:hypothetical protein